MNFQERFKGKVTTMTKDGMDKVVVNTIQPINKSKSSNFDEFTPDSTPIKTSSQNKQKSTSKIYSLIEENVFRK